MKKPDTITHEQIKRENCLTLSEPNKKTSTAAMDRARFSHSLPSTVRMFCPGRVHTTVVDPSGIITLQNLTCSVVPSALYDWKANTEDKSYSIHSTTKCDSSKLFSDKCHVKK